MLFSHRVFRAPSLGVHLSCRRLLHSRFRFAWEVRRGLIEDSGVVAPSVPQRADLSRPMLVFCLAGRTLVRSAKGEHLLEPGSVLTWSLDDTGSFRHEGEPSVVLAIDWELGSLGTRGFDGTELLQLSPTALRRLQGIIQGMSRQALDPDQASHGAEALLSLLRAEGLPVDQHSAGDLWEGVDPFDAALWRAVDLAASALHRRPMVQDLEDALQCSGRLIQDRFKAFHARYSFHATGGWREHLRRWRLPLGVAVMSAPSARTEEVAKLLGYASSTEFCRAFANAGLPSPGAIRERIQELA